jgi:Domain of unknown function (DUF2431)/Zinc finger C-x8-C-x5-C-x3-H type (and similar)/RNA-binding, Nab2-type zinc finger
LASSSNDIKDTVGVLNKCLDPPESKTVQDAFSYLKDIGACVATRGQRSKLVATDYGTLLATLPFNVEESRTILSAARRGYLHEMLLLMSIQTICPSPIVTFFADRQKSAMALQTYNSDVNTKDPLSVIHAHMSAFMFWDADWNRCRRQSAYSLFYRLTGGDARFAPANSFLADGDLLDSTMDQNLILKRRDCGVWQWTLSAEESHMEWCQQRLINPTSVRAIAETVDVTMKILYHSKFEPAFLRCCPVEPKWQHSEAALPLSPQMLRVVYGAAGLPDLSDANGMSAAAPPTGQTVLQPASGNEVCIHFLNGNCRFGDRCNKAHTSNGKRPICKFFAAGDCTNGDTCVFAHDNPATANATIKAVGDPLVPLVPLRPDLMLNHGAKGWFLAHAPSLVLFGENNFMFTGALVALGAPPLLSTEYAAVDTTSHRFSRLNANKVRTGVDATRIHAQVHFLQDVVHGIRAFAWNFPFTSDDEDEASHEDLILATFLSVGLLCRQANIGAPKFALALQADQLSRWSVLRSANYSGWVLQAWGVFDHADFPGYRPCRASGDPFPYDRGRLYVFELKHAP